MIQSGQTSVRTKSASARSPLRLLCKHVALLPQRRGGLLGTGTGREGGKRVKARPRTDPEDRGDRGPSPKQSLGVIRTKDPSTRTTRSPISTSQRREMLLFLVRSFVSHAGITNNGSTLTLTQYTFVVLVQSP